MGKCNTKNEEFTKAYIASVNGDAQVIDVDYRALKEKDFFYGHIRGINSEGVHYKLVCYILRYRDGERIVPVWWEMFTYNDYGDSILNDFNFNDINWF